MQHTIVEPHISIQSSSNDDFNANSNFHQTCNQAADTSNHSININSFQTFNHDNTHANASEPPSIGKEMHNDGEPDRDSYQNHTYDDGDVENVDDVNDETSDTYEEVGNYYGDGNINGLLAIMWDIRKKVACSVMQVKCIALGDWKVCW